MGTIQKKKLPLGFGASQHGIRAKVYELPGTQCWYKHHSLVKELRLQNYLGLDGAWV